MVVEYTKGLGATRFCVLWRLLFRWRGSVYKLLWQDLLVYAVLYASLSCLYRFYLHGSQKRLFEEVVLQSNKYRDLVPVSFLLGVYVSVALLRCWAVCLALPNNAAAAMLLSTYIPRDGSRAFEIKTRVVRYINLTYALVFSQVSAAVHLTYPDLQALVDHHFLTVREKEVLEEAEGRGCSSVKWLPLTWSCQLVQSARDEGFIDTEASKEALLKELLDIQRQCCTLLEWHQYNVPLVYTQVVTIAVYTYFLFSVLSEQYLDATLRHPRNEADLVVPAFALLELVMYLGLLKVAETLINPFGVDDNSFDFLKFIRDARLSAFVICHTRYGKFTPEVPWRPREGSPITIVDLSSSPRLDARLAAPSNSNP
ncbi:bestrophin-3-like isoform X2 [Eriocheir sinensis]|uniref:bestrophin-3-like isoform X2 n=1 Tax=Eriocheir sinensis TaxID=95602 RepID=UPI0021C7E447|nr:bestrophin-3-like isoform X2 [Eriocheir sinensis]